jgi:hypothetical protein
VAPRRKIFQGRKVRLTLGRAPIQEPIHVDRGILDEPVTAGQFRRLQSSTRRVGVVATFHGAIIFELLRLIEYLLMPQYHRKRLFNERPDALLHASPFEKRSVAPLVSTPERALLIPDPPSHRDKWRGKRRW